MKLIVSCGNILFPVSTVERSRTRKSKGVKKEERKKERKKTTDSNKHLADKIYTVVRHKSSEYRTTRQKRGETGSNEAVRASPLNTNTSSGPEAVRQRRWRKERVGVLQQAGERDRLKPLPTRLHSATWSQSRRQR